MRIGSMQAMKTHLKCHKCGYDLHGLAAAGECPECGASVVVSSIRARWPKPPRWILFAEVAYLIGATATTFTVWLASGRAAGALISVAVCVYVGLIFGGAALAHVHARYTDRW